MRAVNYTCNSEPLGNEVRMKQWQRHLSTSIGGQYEHSTGARQAHCRCQGDHLHRKCLLISSAPTVTNGRALKCLCDRCVNPDLTHRDPHAPQTSEPHGVFLRNTPTEPMTRSGRTIWRVSLGNSGNPTKNPKKYVQYPQKTTQICQKHTSQTDETE